MKLNKEKIKTSIPLLLCFIFFAFFIIYQTGSISLSFDEISDSNIADCYQQTKNPLLCPEDITQTRFPHYLHAALRSILFFLPSSGVDHAITIIFCLTSFILICWFAKKEFNQRVANFTALGIATSIPLIASGKLILTHSNAIFATITLGAIITFYYFVKNNQTKYLIYSAFLYGLSIASSLVGVTTFFFFIIFYLLGAKSRKALPTKIFLFLIISIATFFIFSVIHTQPQHLNQLIAETQLFRNWFNYLGLGHFFAPAWFSLVLFVVKISPWWAILFFISIKYLLPVKKNNIPKIFLLSAFIFIIVYLVIKSIYFKYDAPHHQLVLYYLAYLLIGYTFYSLFTAIKKPVRKILLASLLGLMVIAQIYYLILFFPNLLFYGHQYGDRMIGEIYGPAVVLCQDFDQVETELKKIVAAGHTPIVLNGLCFNYSDLPRDYFYYLDKQYTFHHQYVYTDVLMAEHFQLVPQKKAYQEYLKRKCQKYFSHSFPGGKEVYFIYQCPVNN